MGTLRPAASTPPAAPGRRRFGAWLIGPVVAPVFAPFIGSGAWASAPAGHGLPIRRERRALFGSWAELTVSAPEPVASDALAAAWARLSRFDRDGNAWKPGALQRINAALRAGRSAELPEDLARLILQARDLEADSAGACNIAIGAAVAAWGFHADRLRDGAPAPDPARLRALAGEQPPSTRALRLHGGRIASVDRRVQLDLGAVGKGHAADLALDLLRQAGVRAALVNLGGNLAAMGEPGGHAWRIGIRRPGADTELSTGLAATLAIDGREAVITSAQSERRRRLPDGRWIGHVLDARTLQPAIRTFGLTVVDADATRADALATALLAADPATPWPELTTRLGATLALRIHADGRLDATPALAARLQPA